MKSLDEESRVFARVLWVLFYLLATILGGSWAIDAGDEIRRRDEARGQQRSTANERGLQKFLAPVTETIKSV